MGLFVINIAGFVALICCHCGGFVVGLRWNYGGLRWFMMELRWFAVVLRWFAVVELRWFAVGF